MASERKTLDDYRQEAVDRVYDKLCTVFIDAFMIREEKVEELTARLLRGFAALEAANAALKNLLSSCM